MACEDIEEDVARAMLRCVRCGKCREICPVLDAESPGTPGWEILGSRGRVRLVLGLEEGAIPPNDLLVKSEYTCFFCNQCVENCPCSVAVTELVARARNKLFALGRAPAAEREMAGQVASTGNIFGLDAEDRLLWAFEVEDAIKARLNRPAEVLFFVGCQGSYKGSLADVPVGLVKLLERAGVDYTLLGEAERCCGDPQLLVGDETAFHERARENVAQIQALGVQKVIFTCPGCFNTFTKYARVLKAPLPFALQFATDFLADLLETGALTVSRPLHGEYGTVTYHDPCELGRHQGVYDSPRALLQAIPGIQFREMPATREHTRCCGGGGLVGAAYPAVREGQAARKVREFKANGVDIVVTACYACFDTLAHAAATYSEAHPDDPLRVVDLFDLLGNILEA